MPRFVVLEHDHPVLHWDLMLEAGGVLRTWRLAAPPAPGPPVAAEQTFDHRLMYLDYEGPVSGNRGRVVCWDRGTYAWEGEGGGGVVVRLNGVRLRGRLELERDYTGSWRAQFTPGEGGG
jgi:hypothetical protein